MRVLITGARGQVGRAFAARLHARGDEVAALGSTELDVADAAAVAAAVGAFAPALILHCAAWTDVDGAEADEAAALRINGEGARNVARAACGAGARLLALSTDFVFDGAKRAPYLESDAPAPLSAYGRTKLEGERAVLEEHPGGTWLVRTAWVYDESGKNFVRTMLRLAAARESLRVVVDQSGSPTYAGHLADGCLALVESCPPGLYHLAGSGSCSRLEWARAAIDGAGLRCRVEPATSAEFPLPAPRPASSALASEHACTPVLPPWRDGLAACLQGLEPS